ncbi:MAG TPA: winged helix-turn-helix domain-containing protein, partial [Gaiellaceae bacterium]
NFAITETSAPTRIEMWAMAHPLRLQILGLLGDGPSTASRLGRRLGESSGSMSYHLRVLERGGAIVEAAELGTRRERWWRRRAPAFIPLPTDDDPEGRAIAARMHGYVFERDEKARLRFVTRDVGTAWRESAVVGNWLVELTPEEAAELGERLVELVRAIRPRTAAPEGAGRALVSISILPWLE